jgi:hypothetical protein
MVYVPKVPPPLDEIEIDNNFNRSHTQKPHLIVSMECLGEILGRESSIIAAEDIPRLLAALCQYALQADIGDNALAAHLESYYKKQTELDE